MPDTVKKKLDDRTLVARLQTMGATWDDPRWIVPTDQRPALLALLDEAGYA
jgi:hypothetical protein